MILGFLLRATFTRLRNFSTLWIPLGLGCSLLLTGCSLPQVSAESRLFLNLSASLVADYTLPQTTFDGGVVGKFSGLTYDAQRDRLYGLVDDPETPRVYTLQLNPKASAASPSALTITAVTPLKVMPPEDSSQKTQSQAPVSLEGQGIVLTRRGTIFVASGGNPDLKRPPRLSEFDLSSGAWQRDLPLPKQYWNMNPEGTLTLGVRPQGGLKSLTINTEGDRLFAATRAPLQQETSGHYSRFLHYWIGEPEPLVISEHLYPLDSSPGQEIELTDLIAIDNAGHFLSLERRYSPDSGYGAVLYQLATGVATDTSGLRTLPSTLKGIVPILKQPLLDLTALNIPLQDLEGLTLGPRLQDGSRSLLLIGNASASSTNTTQMLLLRLSQRMLQAKA